MVGIQMYAEIQRLKALGYKKQRAARQLELDTKTVKKYWNMSEELFIEQKMESRERVKILDPYKDFVLTKIKTHREITSAIIYDNLLEEYKNFQPSYRSVRRYVSLLREAEGLPSPLTIRQYMEVQETPLGFQGQVDMGQQIMLDSYGNKVKVYIFAMVLSASRYKFTYFQTEPFTAKTFCEAHDKAFEYFGGRPTELVYDQDRVMVVSENGGDIIYTQQFETYKNYAGFSVHLCRGYDPESKGKIEAVVKYVKGNFLSCRVFHGISRLCSDGLAWLDRTGNGQIHHTTKMVPKTVFLQEQKHLKATPKLGDTELLPKIAIIRKNNIVMYRQNRYCMPKGSYSPNKKARIEVDETRKIVGFYDAKSGEKLIELPLTDGVGKCVRDTHPNRSRETKHSDLLQKVLEKFGENEQAKAFVSGMIALKPRYTRDQLCKITKLQDAYSKEILDQSIAYCMSHELYTATDLTDTLEFLSETSEPVSIPQVLDIPIKYRMITAEIRPLEAYNSLTEGGSVHD